MRFYRDAIVCCLGARESNNLKNGIVYLHGIFSCRRLLEESSYSPDDVACTIPLSDDARERVIDFTNIRRFRAKKTPGS
jgi:hypothetical protein